MAVLRSLALFFLEFLETAVIALLFFAIMYIFLFQPHQVKGNSMLPNFVNGEYLLSNKLTYRFGEPDRGDVVVFKAPGNNQFDYIKRVIGLPEDKIEILQGHIYINGQLIDESSYLSPIVETRSGYYLQEAKEIVIPPNHYFVGGDNRANSSDSRDFGPIPKQNIIGKAWFMYWPPQKIGLIGEKTYGF